MDITFEEWKEKYKPIMEGDSIRIFETYGSDTDILRLLPSDNIWTAVDNWINDEGEPSVTILSGCLWVNRQYYIVTKEKWETKYITVELEENQDA